LVFKTKDIHHLVVLFVKSSSSAHSGNCWHQLELLAPAGTVGIIWCQLEPVRISWKLLEIEKGAK